LINTGRSRGGKLLKKERLSKARKKTAKPLQSRFVSGISILLGKSYRGQGA